MDIEAWREWAQDNMDLKPDTNPEPLFQPGEVITVFGHRNTAVDRGTGIVWGELFPEAGEQL